MFIKQLRKFADNANMDVITCVGKRASVSQTPTNLKYKKTKSKNVSENPYEKVEKTKEYTSFSRFGVNGYSPKNDNQKNEGNQRLKVSKVSSFSIYYRLVFLFLSLAIFAVVPYFTFAFFNNQLDTNDWTKYIFTDNSEVEFSKIESDVCDGIFETKINESFERIAFTQNQNDAQFDNDGNLILSDGISISAEDIVLGEPVTYSNYKVKSGDTIESITYKFGLRTISTLIAINDIKNVRTLRAGQKLLIPSQDGLIHKVTSGESLNSLSLKYRVSVEDILDTNDLTSDVLSIGQKLFIPGAKLDLDALRNAMGETFICPISAKWRLTSHFGRRIDPISGVPSSHTGIDMACPTGTTIKAAMSGSVIKAGWSNIYGYYVIIKHPNGYQSLYGHMTKYVVKTGQLVDQGTRIGYVGSTGYSTGPHLHFTVYKNAKRVDPLPLIKK